MVHARTFLAATLTAAALALTACGDEAGEPGQKEPGPVAADVGTTEASTQTQAATTTTPTETTTTPATTETTTTEAGGGDTAALETGKKVFASAGCVSCHTLKDSNASGTVGPNLDQVKPDEATVKQFVTNGKAPMPAFKGQLSDDEIDAVATYVSSVAGR